MAKSWAQKLEEAKPPHAAVLDKPYAGVPASARLLIASPLLVERYVAAIPRGETRSVAKMRRDPAERHGADATCPTSTAIFTRIVAEAALDQLRSGVDRSAIAPFWRQIDPASPLARRLSCGPEFVADARASEATY